MAALGRKAERQLTCRTRSQPHHHLFDTASVLARAFVRLISYAARSFSQTSLDFLRTPSTGLLFGEVRRGGVDRLLGWSMDEQRQDVVEQGDRGEGTGDAFAHLAAMESDLWRLSGLMLAGRMLGEAEDHVDPTAIAALAGCSIEIIERLQANWKLAFEAAIAGQRARANAS